jgi:hypothetical protein
VGGGHNPKARKGQKTPSGLTPRVQRGQRDAPTRTPRARPLAERTTDYPSFSFQHADHNYSGSWRWFQGDEGVGALTFLADIGRLTWSEIGNQNTGGRRGRRKHHPMAVSELCKEAQDRLAQLGYDEIFGDEIYRFRLRGKWRLWGFLQDGVFYVVWWDPDHQVYPTDPG